MKIGTKVRMVNCAEAEKYSQTIWTTRSEPWPCCGRMLVSLEGRAGGFNLACLEAVADDEKEPLRACPSCGGGCEEVPRDA